MVNLTQSTKSVKAKEIIRVWHLIDVKGKILGRAIPDAVKFLQGKHKSNYSQHLDQGDYVVITNAKYIEISGNKALTKLYTNYSGYPGGLKTIRFKELLEKNPENLLRRAISGMLPKNKLRDRRLARLFIFANDNHPYKDKFEQNHGKKN